MRDSYKKLHTDWKAAKKNAEKVYDYWARQFSDFSRAHEDVKHSAPPFPKFKLDLGPSLDKLEAQKDVEKYQAKAEKAVKQYIKDIKELQRGISKLAEPEGSDGKKLHKAMSKYANELLEVIERIESKLSE